MQFLRLVLAIAGRPEWILLLWIAIIVLALVIALLVLRIAISKLAQRPRARDGHDGGEL